MSETPASEPPLSPEQYQPTNLDLDLRGQALRIDWADGVSTTLTMAFLRQHCPCATCRTEREKRSRTLLPILTSSPGGEIHVTGAHLVGNYAMQLEWSDGHDSGIYDFELLRAFHAEVSSKSS